MAGLTLFVRGLPENATSERLEEIFGESGPLRQCFVVREKGAEKCRGLGYVTFSMLEDAQKAMKEIKEYDGKKIEVMVAKKKLHEKDKKAKAKDATEQAKQSKPKDVKVPPKKARLIIRNLSFKSSEEELKTHFSTFGSVMEVNIPKKPDGNMRGFAFVQFKNMLEASKALKGTNMKSIKGRTVAVDWAVAKDKYTATQGGASETKKSSGKLSQTEALADAEDSSDDKDDTSLKDADEGDEDDLSEDDSTQKEESEYEQETSQPKTKGSKVPIKKSQATRNKVLKEEESEDDQEKSSDDEDNEDDDESADSGQDSDTEDDSGDSDSESEKIDKTKVKKKLLPSDVKEGRTLFIRNLSFNSEEDDLEELLLKYGSINYVRIVLHPDTEHSKGCAFVQFVDRESAEKCLAAAKDDSENGGLKLAGRKLFVDLAVSREEAGKLCQKKVKKPTGTRNLYLAREGFIREGTKPAEGLSPEDLAKRARFLELKRLKLKNQNIFVSRTRLCVHNIPKSVDDKKLRQVFLNAAGGGRSVKIKECRVMRDMKGVGGNIKGQSLGYAFLEFAEHEHALTALRQVNNNPDLFGPKKRPIVEFSLEDLNKLKIKERRAQRSLEVLKQKQAKEQAADTSVAQPSLTNAKKKSKNKKANAPPMQTATDKKIDPNTQKGTEAQKAAATVQGTSIKSQPTDLAPPKAVKRPHPANAAVVKTEGNLGLNAKPQWLGFQTKEEIEHQELPDGKKRRKVLPLPSHTGSKIRARDKGKVQQLPPKRPKSQEQTRKHQRQMSTLKQEPAKKRKPQRSQQETHFNQLVEQYKRKILGKPNSTAPVKKSKWFED
ncbi:RNA-binding protein 28 isoform X1 [Bufo gargarizans]|uniref:RNA-binding protein 28 isoform X1 n=1 Tax=Bufo gargarizans TaxID=30331 RepID=UPI001CF30DC7|nr:RNA-binding protein 28 isoform X1 [Bufo gargarizans]